ncbi:hypothetical protein E1B28_010602 [Marasmius oreades]|uniref:Uncharacterized protein n=1 Tax=Marasmius oreades TaxID=181124 RepID=A0A9P7URY2_9AGAR|nr:uncharacterized protein E1B28_010602 [Marasmius oreades]KAG7091580.1 hypothetical protein E1B28_010602 [Marasmius oreades]
MQLYGGQSFTNANQIINYNYPTSTEPEPHDDRWLTLHGGQRLRHIDMCDINMLREVSSETLSVSFKLKSTNPFRNRMGSVVKIQKRTQSAEIVPGFGDRRFTVVSLEPENERDVERIQRVLKRAYEIALSRRRVWLTQLFGVGRSMIPTLIYHDDVVDGETIIRQYVEVPIVIFYLTYIYANSLFDVHADGTLQKLSIPLSTQFRDWMFNSRTQSFRYDIITTALTEDNSQPRYFDRPIPLPRGCNPPLNSNEIIRALPDFIRLISKLGEQFNVERSNAFIHRDVLTFGTVVNLTKPGILAYFPSTSSPVWSCNLPIGTPDIVPKYSKSVPSLVELTFTTKNDIWQMDIQFSLRLPDEVCQRLRNSYLVQSFPFYNDNAVDFNNLVFIDEFSFLLNGTFTSDPSSCDPPQYLHVPPLSTERIDDMPSLHPPLKNRLFYWSFDRSGKTQIAEEDWERYGIPKLKVEMYIGSRWWWLSYGAVRDYLRFNDYDLGGQQFANDHGYPILVKGEPHIQLRSGMVSWLGENVFKPFGGSSRKIVVHHRVDRATPASANPG